MQQNLLKKLSIATALNPKKGFLASLVPNKGDETMLLRVVGIVSKCVTGMSTYGEYQEFHGEFQATTLVGDTAGQVSLSAKCFLPSPVDVLLKQTLASLSEDKKSVEFAFDIGVKHLPAKSADDEAGYEYIVKNLIESKASDPLANLLKHVSAVPLPALAAPVAASEGTDKASDVVSEKADDSAEKGSEKTGSKKAAK